MNKFFSISFYIYIDSIGGSFRTILRITNDVNSDASGLGGRILLVQTYPNYNFYMSVSDT